MREDWITQDLHDDSVAKKYVQEVADDFGVEFEDAWILWIMLGPNEAFDGFVTSIQDLGEM